MTRNDSRSGFSPLSMPDIPRSNYVWIKRANSAIKGTYLIDPNLVIPEALLATRQAEADAEGATPVDGQESARKNLLLESAHSSVNADIWIVNGPTSEDAPSQGSDGATNTQRTDVKRAPASGSGERVQKVLLEVKSINASVRVKVNTDFDKLPFELIASSRHGSVGVSIPQAFVGPVTIRTIHGSVGMSKSLEKRMTTFSDSDHIRKCFVGDFASAGFGRGEWKGSSLDISSDNGSVRLSFSEENVESDNKSIWTKLFDMW